MSDSPPAVEVRVLGPVEVLRDGRPVDIGGPLRRNLLALLATRLGRFLSAERLIDELWRDEPPAHAAATLRAHVSKLRGALGDPALIRGGWEGYSLVLPPQQIDHARFERLLNEAAELELEDQPRRALDRLITALALWRDPPFGGLAREGILAADAARLEGLRLDGLERRFEVELDLGRSTDLIEELEALVREQPLRERLWELLVLALYRGGRQADALSAYGRARATLDTELGIEPGEALERLQLAILRHEVPGPRAGPPPAGLPASVSSFTGRATELHDIARLLAAGRLVTLTGVGGVGKTRLAIEGARAITSPDGGATFVDLSGVADQRRVASSVAAAYGIRDDPSASLVDRLAGGLGGPERLLVLDNCEHVRDVVAELAAALLARAPRLRILATSREVIGVPGEVDYAVPPLSLPPEGATDLETRASDAVGLFLARAGAARSGLQVDDGTVAVAARICRELDGLPLAIELAAARANAFSLEDIHDRLAERFRFLVSRGRLLPERHRTLAAAMDWSFDLLSLAERELLAGLSVFRGGFTVAAIVDVCLAGDETRAVELLQRLVDASLVVLERDGPQTRYGLLESVRAYAALRLQELGLVAERRASHASHFGRLVDQAWVPIRLEGGEWIAKLADEHDNLRAALRWTRDVGAIDDHLRLVEGLWWYWSVHGDLAEGRDWLNGALPIADGVEPGLRARALLGASSLAWLAGDLDQAFEVAGHARALLADLTEIDTPGGTQPATRFESMAWETMGLVALARGEHHRARTLLETSRQAVEKLPADSPWRPDNLAIAEINLGLVALDEGDLPTATVHFTAAGGIMGGFQNEVGAAVRDFHLGAVAIENGRLDDATRLLRSALATFSAVRHVQFGVDVVDAIALLAWRRGRNERAAECLAAATSLRHGLGYRAFGWQARQRAHLAEKLGPAGPERSAPADMTFGRAVRLGLDALAEPVTGSGRD